MIFQSSIKTILKDKYIIIYDDQGKTIGYLDILSISDTNDENLVEKFTNWRRRYKDAFFTLFEPSTEKTKKWLENLILNHEDRAFFKIYDHKKILIGHAGAIKRKGFIEYDNLIRGEITDVKQFMYFVELSFMKFLFDFNKPEYIFGQCLSNNERVLKLHEQTGFIVDKKIPFKKININENEVKWVEEKDIEKTEIFNLEIKLYEKAFLEKIEYPILKDIFIRNQLLLTLKF